MASGRLSRIAPYLLALAAVAAATLIRWSLTPAVGGRLPFAMYFVAVALAGLYGNIRSALLATALSAVAGTFFFVDPPMAFAAMDSPDAFALLTFIVAGSIIAVLAGRFEESRARLEASAHANEQQARDVELERRRLRAIINSVPGVVWEAWGEPDSSRQRINFVSDYVETLLGYKPDDWTATPNFWLSCVHPEDRERAARVAAEKFASGGVGENEFRWVTKDGRAIWVLARSTTLLDERGTPVGMRGVTFDISVRKEVEQRLEILSEISATRTGDLSFSELAGRIARRIAETVGEYCIIRMRREDALETVAAAHVDPAGEPIIRRIASYSNIVALSNLYADVFERPRTLIENDLREEAFSHVDRTGAEDAFQRYRARRALFTPLLVQGRLVGTLAVGRASGEPYTEADARFCEAIAARASLALENARLVEVAQRDADEARKARAEAEEAGRVKDEFLATLSHELRTPLNAILGWAHMLKDPRLPEERRAAAVDTILRNAQSQEQLISDILDVQRIIAGKIRLNVRPVDLGNVVRAAAETVQPTAEARQVKLQLLLDLDVPTITGDPDRLQQVVWNLLTNAIKFAPVGGRVQVRLARNDGTCTLVVEDDGPGINPEFIPFMWERFRQADSSTTRTHKGLGLGLAIVRSLVEMHGGTIEAANTSRPGSTGAVFTIRLPRETASVAIVDAQAATPAA
jgi:PAS domain S-box-containing protein